MHNDELIHYGVKGMKWGVRRFQNKDGDLYIHKGTTVKRVSNNKSDVTYDNKKYVSINQEDHDKWETYLGEEYVKRNIATFNIAYKTTKDLKIMSSTKQGKKFADMMMADTKFRDQAIKDISYSDKQLRQKSTNDYAENISRNIAMQTATGKAFIQKIMSEGYDAVVDTHGTNVSENPLIVLNPDTNLSRISEPEYTRPVKEFLERYYGMSA